MRIERCPKCNARIAPTDTHCLDCGEDLLAHLEELRRAATEKKELTDEEKRERAQAIARAAARGRAFGVERSDETRMRTFDKAHAETTKGDIGGAWGTCAIALVVGIAGLAYGFSQANAVGGLEGLKTLSLGELRRLGFGMFAATRVLAVMGMLTGLGGVLAATGQAWRAILAHMSVAAVARGEKPTIVFIPPPTRAGMLVISIALPPVGLIMGLCLIILGKTEEVKSVGRLMLYGGLAAAVFLGANMLYSIAENIKTPDKAPAEKQIEETASLIRMLC